MHIVTGLRYGVKCQSFIFSEHTLQPLRCIHIVWRFVWPTCVSVTRNIHLHHSSRHYAASKFMLPCSNWVVVVVVVILFFSLVNWQDRCSEKNILEHLTRSSFLRAWLNLFKIWPVLCHVVNCSVGHACPIIKAAVCLWLYCLSSNYEMVATCFGYWV